MYMNHFSLLTVSFSSMTYDEVRKYSSTLKKAHDCFCDFFNSHLWSFFKTYHLKKKKTFTRQSQISTNLHHHNLMWWSKGCALTKIVIFYALFFKTDLQAATGRDAEGDVKLKRLSLVKPKLAGLEVSSSMPGIPFQERLDMVK